MRQKPVNKGIALKQESWNEYGPLDYPVPSRTLHHYRVLQNMGGQKERSAAKSGRMPGLDDLG